MLEPLFVDTGYIIALVNKNDAHHEQALFLSKKYETFPVVTTTGILSEIGNAFSRTNRKQAVQIIQYFSSAEEATVVSLTVGLFKNSLEIYKKHSDKTWGLVDCISFAVMRTRKIKTALAFDHHFEQSGYFLAK